MKKPHVSRFGFKKRGPVKGWIVVDHEGFKSERQLRSWLASAIRYVEKLPTK
jgi:hypothetical protein